VSISISLLGGFAVLIENTPVEREQWARRQAATLVKVLALAPGRRLHREQVIEALWPGAAVKEAGPRLHKAAHYARRALGDDAAVTLRHEMVALLPGHDVVVDVDRFLDLARRAEASGADEDRDLALAAYGGTLLPDDPYEPWAEQPREHLRQTQLDLLRGAGRWEDVLLQEPTDEQAHLALVRAHLDRGDVRAAERQLERLDQALRRELGTRPSAEAEELRSKLTSAVARSSTSARVRLVGRRPVGDRVRSTLDAADRGNGATLLVSGPPGVGKTAVLGLAESMARKSGWRTGRGTASAVEGPWPYAVVLEAFADLSRRHPALLDGLDDAYYAEIERALSGRDFTWSGESAHQRLFVAVAELMRLAAAGHGLMLVIDDLQDADEASLRLLHYLSRCAMSERVVLVVAHRPTLPETARQIEDSLLRKGAGTRIELGPLSLEATKRLLRDQAPTLPPSAAEEIHRASGGLPFVALELARGHGEGPGSFLPALSLAAQETFQRVALLGGHATTDEIVALADGSEDDAYRHLEEAVVAGAIEPAETGYRFRHPLLREQLVDAVPAHRRASIQRDVAERIAQLGGSPVRLAHLFLAAGLPSRAVPYVVRAVETAGALGAYRDALALVDAVRDHADPEDLPRLLARRGDLLQALGDPEAIAAYLEAWPQVTGTEQRLVRARLGRAAALAGELQVAEEALAGLEPEGDAADGLILLGLGNLAFFTGDIESAWRIANEGRGLLNSRDDPTYLLDLVSLQGLVAHQRGEWFERFQMELRRTQGRQRLATVLFDAHLCVAEYVLYGQVPYDEVIADAEELLRQADRAGALRGVAFARALIGEAAMLKGDLARAEIELNEAAELHRDTDAPAGESHALQRLAEVRLVQGDHAEADRLLQRALLLARWSVVANHLLHRIYGTMVRAARTPEQARAVVDRAWATLGDTDQCSFCLVMFAVPAAIACAEVGDLGQARSFLAQAEGSVAQWPGTAWEAAVDEARASLALAEGRDQDAFPLLTRAVAGFERTGQPNDAARCRAALAELFGPTADSRQPSGAPVD
jgi:DNA-binding SARP family transcriptional activator/tetratricopeptide (TPR) repeat protein